MFSIPQSSFDKILKEKSELEDELQNELRASREEIIALRDALRNASIVHDEILSFPVNSTAKVPGRDFYLEIGDVDKDTGAPKVYLFYKRKDGTIFGSKHEVPLGFYERIGGRDPYLIYLGRVDEEDKTGKTIHYAEFNIIWLEDALDAYDKKKK